MSRLRSRHKAKSTTGETKEDEMKTARIILICLSLTFLASAAISVVVPNYLVMNQQTEKWYKSEGSGPGGPGQVPALRIHSLVNGFFNGAIILEREIWLENDVIDSDRLLFSKDLDGNINFFGDLDEYVLDDPILWVDAPLATGKIWTDSHPEFPGGTDPENMIHYVFAVLGKRDITCPAGTFPAHRVFLSILYPDGHAENETFWYNSHCGMVMCTRINQRTFELQKAIIPGQGEYPEVHCDKSMEGVGLSDLKASPNPLNPMTTISFDLGNRSRVDLRVYDVSGKLVRTLVGGDLMEPGTRSVLWNGKDDRGNPAASGSYIYKLQAGGKELTNRMTLIR
jgi:hypothetical protein